MFRDPLEMEAARTLLAALDAYETSFDAMVAADMASDLHAEVNDRLAQIRQAASTNARDLLFSATHLVLAHTSLTSKLWQRQVGRQRRGGTPVAAAEIDSLREAHKRCVKRLRDRCQSLIAKPAPS
jgi:hypothetical protein